MPSGGCARTFGAACQFVDDLLRRAPIGERDLVKRQPQVGPGEGKGVKAGLRTRPCDPESIIGRLMRPAVDRLPGIRYHCLADGRRPMQVIAAAWLTGPAQQGCCEESRER